MELIIVLYHNFFSAVRALQDLSLGGGCMHIVHLDIFYFHLDVFIAFGYCLLCMHLVSFVISSSLFLNCCVIASTGKDGCIVSRYLK